MKINYLLLGLVALATVIGLYMAGSPEQSERISEMNRNVAFTGEARDTALVVLGVGLAAFIAYLAFTRR